MDITVFSELIANIVSFLFGFMKGVDLSPIASALETVKPFLQGALYLLPAQTLAQIFSISCAIWSLKLTVKSITLLWSLLPIV